MRTLERRGARGAACRDKRNLCSDGSTKPEAKPVHWGDVGPWKIMAVPAWRRVRRHRLFRRLTRWSASTSLPPPTASLAAPRRHAVDVELVVPERERPRRRRWRQAQGAAGGPMVRRPRTLRAPSRRLADIRGGRRLHAGELDLGRVTDVLLRQVGSFFSSSDGNSARRPDPTLRQRRTESEESRPGGACRPYQGCRAASAMLARHRSSDNPAAQQRLARADWTFSQALRLRMSVTGLPPQSGQPERRRRPVAASCVHFL